MSAIQPTRRRGYHRPRPQPTTASIDFEVQGHKFETDWRELWVALPGTERVDRIKITRSYVSRSAQRGYPAELFRSEEPLAEAAARAMAAFWLEWKETADAAGHKPVRLGHYQRNLELEGESVLQEAK